MASRLWVCALAFVLAAAPLAPVLCRANCALHDAAVPVSHGERHSCHEASSDSVALVPGAHTCGHQNDVVVALQAMTQDIAPPALSTSAMSTIAPVEQRMRLARSPRLEHSPPGLASLNAPLRL
ncbi:MAG TPA: hypothetical protein VGF24_24685 [Vicinamibacterales bacterium]|jgi:hypothetical protein